VREALWGYLLVAPLMLGLLIFYIWPIFQTFYFSLTKWGDFGTYRWAGFTNYARLLHDPDLLSALRNTLVYAVLVVSGSIVLSLCIAALLNQKIRGIVIFRTIYFLPTITMPAAISMVWRWIYNGDIGLLNYLLFRLFSIHGPYWLSDPRFALYAVIVIAIWSSVGTNVILFMAGMQAIPQDYYEAASLDGAGVLPRFLRITLPLLSPSIFFVTMTSLISAFQVFDLIFLVISQNSTTMSIGSSPAIGAVQTIVYLFYVDAFALGDKGYAAAIAVLLFLIILLITAVQFALQRRWVHYA
jgi:multiple sugar transport system permease protein